MAKHLIKTEKKGVQFVSKFIDRLRVVEKRVEKVLANKYGIKYPFIGRSCDRESASDGEFGSASEVLYLENYTVRNWDVSIFCTCGWGYSRTDDHMDVHVIYHAYEGEDKPSDRIRVYVAQGKPARDKALRKVEELILRHCLKLHDEHPGMPRWDLPEQKVPTKRPKVKTFGKAKFSTVKVRGQVWMASNLALDDSGDGIYRNEATGEVYYTWDAAKRIAKKVPGWHLPSVEEWYDLADKCGCKGKRQEFSPEYNEYKNVGVLTERLGITMSGAYEPGDFVTRPGLHGENEEGMFWTSTEHSWDNDDAIRIYIHSSSDNMDAFFDRRAVRCSVRLVKDKK